MNDTRSAEKFMKLEKFITTIKQDAELQKNRKKKKKLLDTLYDEMSKNGVDKS